MNRNRRIKVSIASLPLTFALVLAGCGDTPPAPQPRVDVAEEVLIPAGPFLMGSTFPAVADQIDSCLRESDCWLMMANEMPMRAVEVDAFYIDKFEVTNARYQVCVDAGACTAPHETDATGGLDRWNYFSNDKYGDYPVISVDWRQAVAFCAWAGKRLPREAEWEKAARGTDGRLYPWGNERPNQSLTNSSNPLTTAAGSHPSGASPYGVMDMAGNVWEWTADACRLGEHGISQAGDLTVTTTSDCRVVRGGSWLGNRVTLRTTYRAPVRPDAWESNGGFRCARTP